MDVRRLRRDVNGCPCEKYFGFHPASCNGITRVCSTWKWGVWVRG